MQRLKNAWGCGPVTAAERAGTLYDAAVTMTTSFTMHSLSQHSQSVVVRFSMHARVVLSSCLSMGCVVSWSGACMGVVCG